MQHRIKAQDLTTAAERAAGIRITLWTAAGCYPHVSARLTGFHGHWDHWPCPRPEDNAGPARTIPEATALAREWARKRLANPDPYGEWADNGR